MNTISCRRAACLAALLLAASGLPAQTDTALEHAQKGELAEQAAEEEQIDDSLLPGAEESPSPHADIRSRLAGRLQRAVGYASGRYAGSPLKTYQRVRLFFGDRARAGLLMEKDPGEVRMNDFMCAYLELFPLGRGTRCIVGDFSIETGRGIALGRSLQLGRGPVVLLPESRAPDGLKPYLSASEDGFFRGAAAEFTLGAFQGVLFWSWRERSAVLDERARATSFASSGNFRTEPEIARRGNLAEECMGGGLLFRPAKGFTAGVSFSASAFSRPLALSDLELGAGESHRVASGSLRWSLGGVVLFGECSLTRSGSESAAGVLLSPSRELGLLVSARTSPQGFKSLHSARSMGRGEYDLYLACRVRVSAAIVASGFWDLSRRGAAAPLKLSPEPATETLLQLEVHPPGGPDMRVLSRRRSISSEGVAVNASGLVSAVSVLGVAQNFRLSMEHELSGILKASGRLEYSLLDERKGSSVQRGMAWSAGLIFRPPGGPSLECGLACFRSEGSGAAVRLYESDLPGSSRVNVLSGSGARLFTLIRWRFWPGAELSVKYSDLLRDDVLRIGTGLEELPGDRDTSVGLGCDISI